MGKATAEPIGTTASLEEHSAQLCLELTPIVSVSVAVAKLAVILEVTVALRKIIFTQHCSWIRAELTFNIQCLQGIFLLAITPFFMLSWYDPLEDPDIALGLTLDIALCVIMYLSSE